MAPRRLGLLRAALLGAALLGGALGGARARPALLVLEADGVLGLQFVQLAVHALNASVVVVSPSGDHWNTTDAFERLGAMRLRCDRDGLSRFEALVNPTDYDAVDGCHPEDLKVLAAEFNRTRFDAVVDFSAETGRHISALANLVHTRQYFLASKGVVYPPSLANLAYTEDDAPSVGQRSILQTMAASLGDESLQKLELEESLWRTSSQRQFCATSLRLPPVLGSRDTTNRLAQLLLMLEMEDVPLSASGRTKVSFVDAASVGSAILCILGQVTSLTDGCCCGKAFNVAQPPASLEEVLRVSANAMNETFNTSRSLLPPTYAETVYHPVQLASLFPFVLDTSRLASLGWRPAQPFQTAVAEAATFIHNELLEKTGLEAQRDSLVERLPIALASSPQGMAVLQRYKLRIPFEQPEGWPRKHRIGQARLPASFLLVLLIALVARLILQPRQCEAVAFAGLFGWWGCLCLFGNLTVTTMQISFWVRDWFGFSPPFWMAIFSELGLGVLSLGFCGWVMCSNYGARFERDAVAAVCGIGPRCVLFAIRTTVVFFLLGHKISFRFYGDGLGGVPRPHFEFTWPILVITHEAFLSWRDAAYVVLTYGTFALAVCRAMHAAFGQVLAVGSPVSIVVLGLPTLLAVMVSVFETHHLLEEAKLLKFAGTTGCIWIALVWFFFLPSFFLLWWCRLELRAWRLASRAAVSIAEKGGIPVKSKTIQMNGTDDREALVGGPTASHKNAHMGAHKVSKKHGKASKEQDGEIADVDEI